MKIQKLAKRAVSTMLCVTMVLTSLPIEALASVLTSTDSNAAPVEYEMDNSNFDFNISTPSNAVSETSGKWTYEIVDGYAVINGYSDYEVVSLDIPYQLDDYYVNGIGEEAFVKNTKLEKLYIHGNVIRIAEDAFEGLDVVLQGYNGTEVLLYARENGFAYENVSDNKYFTFTEDVIDYSYTERYELIDEDTIKFGLPEAEQLDKGDLFFVPETLTDLLNVYQVVSLQEGEDAVAVEVIPAEAEDALISVTMKDIELTADWENAVWADGVEVFEEKSDSWSLGGEQSLRFEQELSDWLKFAVEGNLELKGVATVDYSIWNNDLKELSVKLKPEANVKVGLFAESENEYGIAGYDEPAEVEFYLGSVPLVSAAKVVTVNAKIYIKLSAEGEAVFTFGIEGELGVEYNPVKNCFEGIKELTPKEPTFEINGKVNFGPAEALTLDLAIAGELLKIELFEGINFEVEWDYAKMECLDITTSNLLSGEISLENNALKTLLKSETKWSVFEVELNKNKYHFENLKKVDSCTYDSVFKVEFVAFVGRWVPPQAVKGGEKVSEPNVTLNGNFIQGWYKDKNFEDYWDFENDVVKENMVLYARWAKQEREVIYKTNCEEIPDFSQYYYPGVTITKPDNLTRYDYVFNGWYSDENCTEEWDFKYNFMPGEGLTLYAGWTYEEGYDPFAATDEGIADGILVFNGHTYKVYPKASSFAEAEEFCREQGGYLATITSQEENDAIYEYLRASGYTDAYFGLTDKEKEGRWRWSNGEAFTYSNWGGNEPSNDYELEHYGMFYFKFKDGTWNDGDWEKQHTQGNCVSFICEWGDYEVDDQSIVFYSVNEETGEASVHSTLEVENITIDRVFEGNKVTSIGARAFQNNDVVKTIVIPNTVEAIGKYAFAGCTNLESIIIPNSVKSIDVHAFDGCTSLTSVRWSEGAEVIPEYTFRGCTKLEKISNIDLVTTIGKYAFSNCTNLVVIAIPAGVTKINEYTFYKCSNAETILIPGSVSSISNTAFNGVTGIFLYYPDTYAETWLMNSGYSMSSMGVNYKVTYVIGNVGSYDALNQEELEEISDKYVTAGARVLEPKLQIDGYEIEGWYTDSSFESKWEFIKDVMPEENLTLYAQWCESVKSFEFDVIGGYAHITEYTGIQEHVQIPKSLNGYEVVAIAAKAFTGDDIESVYIPETVKIIENGAFDCSNLYEFIIDEKNIYFAVEDGVLYDYEITNLICAPQGKTYFEYEIPEGVESIGAKAFANQEHLSKVVIPDSVIFIPADTFYGNHFLRIYGSISDCAAKTFAKTYGFAYNRYSVTFYNGNEAVYAANFEAGNLIEAYYEPMTNFSTFGGWYKDYGLTEEWDFASDLTPAEDMNLYLKWNSDFVVTPADSGVIITEYVGTLTNVVVPSEISGYSVIGLDSGVFADSKYVSVEVPDSVTDIAEDAVHSNIVLIGNENSETQIFAEKMGIDFEIKKYMLTFNTQGGSYIEPREVIPGSTVDISVPIKSNCYFVGWYQDPELTIPWTDESVMPMADLTLYAFWRIVNTNITDSFDYELLEDGTIEILNYSGNKTVLSIPDEINGYTVSRIGRFAFYENDTILSVAIPETVTSIGEYAFANTALRVVNGCEDLEHIEAKAFSNVSGLRTFPFAESLCIIGAEAFYCCTSMTEISLPESLKEIGKRAFYGNAYLDEVHFADGLESIGIEAFSKCPKLLSVTISSKLRGTAEAAFDSGTEIIYSGSNEVRILDIQQKTTTSVTIQWNNVTGAAGYNLLRRMESDTEYKKVKSVVGTSTTTGSLQTGNTYYFKIQAYGSDKKIIAESNEKEVYVTKFDLPVIKSVSQKSSSTAIMILKALDNAAGYEVYRATTPDGEYKWLKTSETTEFENSGLIPGADYYYRIRAYAKNEEGILEYSNWSEVYHFHMPYKYMTAPENVTVRQTSESTVEICWDEVNGAKGYILYRSINGGVYSQVKKVRETITYNYNLESGITYSYKVSAYFSDQSETVNGAQSLGADITICNIATPLITDVQQSKNNTALLTWTSVKNVTGYELYRAEGETGEYKRVKAVSGLSAENYNLEIGQTYYYKIRAYQLDENGSSQYGAFSPAVQITITPLSKVKKVSVSQIAGNVAQVTWGSVSDADGYEVWYSINTENNFELVEELETRSVKVASLQDGVTYYFTVRAYSDIDGERVFGEYSDIVSIRIFGRTKLRVVEMSDDASVELLWDSVSSAEGYEIWRQEEAGEYMHVNNVERNRYTDSELLTNVAYTYKIRPYRTNSDGETEYSYYSNESAIRVLDTPEISKVTQTKEGTVQISWNEVSGAEGYRLYRGTSLNGSYMQIKSVQGTTTYNYNLDAGTTYYYKIEAYCTVNDAKKYSIGSDACWVTVLDTPTLVDVEQTGKNSVTITWEPVEKATGYKLYRADSMDGTYSYVKKVQDATVILNYNLAIGNQYFYKIRAYVEDGDSTSASAYSDYLSIVISDLKTPSITSCLQTDSSHVYLQWNSVEGAEGYEVIVSSEETGVYQKIASTDETGIEITSLNDGSSYWIRVRAYKIVDGVMQHSPYSSSTNISLIETPVLNYLYQTRSTAVEMLWDEIEGTEGYEIWRKVGSGDYAKVKSVTESKGTNYSLVEGTTYSYRVRAYQTVNGKRSYSGFSNELSIIPISFVDGALPESEHNYANNMDQTWTYSIPGADALLLKFVAETYFQNNYDWFYIMDGDGNLVDKGSYTGSALADQFIKVKGDTVQLRLTSNVKYNGYGFAFEFIKPTGEQ